MRMLPALLIAALSTSCNSTAARETVPPTPTVAVSQRPALLRLDNYPLDDILVCRAVSMRMTAGVATESVAPRDDVHLTARCRNQSDKPVRAFTGTVELVGVFREILVDAGVTHVWPPERPLAVGTTGRVLFRAVQARVFSASSSGHFLKTARVSDLGSTSIHINKIVFQDGTMKRFVERTDDAANVIRNEVEHLN